MNSKFAVFILSNNRSEKVKTYKVLRESGYTGKIFIILDDRDKSIESYKAKFKKEEIVVFNKTEAMNLTDTADNTSNDKAVVYARNMCWKIAKEKGLDNFLVLDDDYTGFDYRSNDKDEYTYKKVNRLDSVFKSFTDFLNNTNIKCIALAQGGDFIGGKEGTFGKKIFLSRKCMNSFFCRTDRPFEFYGLINEDVNCYVLNGSRGEVYFTSSLVSLNQTQTQANDGGLTTIYLELGTYVKSFYSVLYHPSSVVVEEMSTTHKRLHHKIYKDYSYPKIIREDYKKVLNVSSNV